MSYPVVSLPVGFVATKYPGYFWNIYSRLLFTAKLGVLRPLKIVAPSRFNRLDKAAYRVSHEGRKRYLYLNDLEKLHPQQSLFPVNIKPRKKRTCPNQLVLFT